MEISDTLGFLLGTWDLHRTIIDHRSGDRSSFVGRADVVVDEPRRGALDVERARYHETGELSIGTYTGRASRRLAFVRRGTVVTVHFCDGRPFVDLDLRGGHWEGIHDCGDDRYWITTTVQSPNAFEERWRVRGPTKSYDATTTSTRMGRGEAPEAGA